MGGFWYICTFAIAGESVARGYSVTTQLTSQDFGARLVHNGPAFSLDSIASEDRAEGIFYRGLSNLFRVDIDTFARYGV